MKIFNWLVPAWLQWGAVVAMAASIGWTAQGWRQNAEIADLKREAADKRADDSIATLKDLTAAAKNVATAANGYVTARSDLTAAMTAITEDLQNVQKNMPLPADCRPDAGRLRSLQSAVDAANRAAAGVGQQPGSAMPANSGAAR